MMSALHLVDAITILPRRERLADVLMRDREELKAIRKSWLTHLDLQRLQEFGFDLPDIAQDEGRDGAPDLPVASDASGSDLACLAAKSLMERQKTLGFDADPDFIFLLASSPPDETAESAAARIQWELGSKAIPIAIGQTQGCAATTALKFAADLASTETGVETVLIVAAERWRSSAGRIVPGWAVLADGAGAMLLTKGQSRGLRFLGATSALIAGCAPLFPWMGGSDTGFDPFVDRLAELACRLFEQHGAAPERVSHVVGQGLCSAFTDRLRASLADRGMQDASHIALPPFHTMAVDTIAGLEALIGGDIQEDALVLVWTVGLAGQVGCGLFTTIQVLEKP